MIPTLTLPSLLVGFSTGNPEGCLTNLVFDQENHGVNRDVVIRKANEAGYQVSPAVRLERDGMDYLLVFTPQ